MRGKHNRGVAQLASASGLGPEGPVFESQYPDNQARKLTDFSGFLFFLYALWVVLIADSCSGIFFK